MRSLFLPAVLAMALLAACAMDETDPAASSEAEDLLAAEGSWNIVEETQGMEPEQMHQAARAQVDPDLLTTTTPYTEPASQIAMDVNGDIHSRVLRLERQVARLDRNFKKILPPLSKLIVSDTQLDQAIAEVEREQGEAFTSTPVATRATGKAMPNMARPPAAQPVTGGPLRVMGIRAGQHPGRSRLVLDVTGDVRFTSDLDNNEKLLLIELSQASWAAPSTQRFSRNDLVAGYSAQNVQGQGTRVAIELKKPAKIVNAATLKPGDGKGYRVVIDLAAQ